MRTLRWGLASVLFDDLRSRVVDVEIVDRNNSEDPYIPRHTPSEHIMVRPVGHRNSLQRALLDALHDGVNPVWIFQVSRMGWGFKLVHVGSVISGVCPKQSRQQLTR